MSSAEKRDDAVGPILRRAEAERRTGRLWRAKEIPRGAVRSHATDVRILESYGRLLDQLGDRVEAGKYLFLSGVRGPGVDETIEVFLSRHGNGARGDLIAQFPRGVRRAGLGELPPVVESEVEALDLPEHGGGAVSAGAEWEVHEPSARQTFGLLGCALVAVVLVATTIVGLVTIVRWIF